MIHAETRGTRSVAGEGWLEAGNRMRWDLPTLQGCKNSSAAILVGIAHPTCLRRRLFGTPGEFVGDLRADQFLPRGLLHGGEDGDDAVDGAAHGFAKERPAGWPFAPWAAQGLGSVVGRRAFAEAVARIAEAAAAGGWWATGAAITSRAAVGEVWRVVVVARWALALAPTIVEVGRWSLGGFGAGAVVEGRRAGTEVARAPARPALRGSHAAGKLA